MNKRYVLLLGTAIICTIAFFTGFDTGHNSADYLMKERTNILKKLQYGEFTQEKAKEQFYKIESGSQLKHDLEFIDNFNNTEICQIKDMYIQTMKQTSRKSGYEIYDAVIDWHFENGMYENIKYIIAIKKSGEDYKLVRISLQE